MIRPPPISPLFPTTPLFRSQRSRSAGANLHAGIEQTVGIEGPFHRRKRPETRRAPDFVEERRAQPAVSMLARERADRKSTRLNSSHSQISYAVFCLKKKKSE